MSFILSAVAAALFPALSLAVPRWLFPTLTVTVAARLLNYRHCTGLNITVSTISAVIIPLHLLQDQRRLVVSHIDKHLFCLTAVSN